MDDGDPTYPPTFACQRCGGQMFPVDYIGVHGIRYQASDFI